MKVKTPSLLKKIITALSNKTNDLRIRIMIFFLLHKNIDKTSLTHSLQALVSQPLTQQHRKKHETDAFVDEGLLMHYDEAAEEEVKPVNYDEDLTHAIFDELEAEMTNEEDEDEDEEDGEVAVAENVEEEEDIDQAADMFIQRFKRQMQLQKQLSLDRHQRLLLQSNA